MSSDPKNITSDLKPVIGVVGGGQLAQMLVEAASVRNIDVVVQSGSSNDPAAKNAYQVVEANPQDAEGTKRLVQFCNSITFENEWVNIQALQTLEKNGVVFFPDLKALTPLINKVSQRMLLDELDIPGPDWTLLSSIDPIHPELPSGWKFPLMAKAGRGGYDGKGTRKINSINELVELIRIVDPQSWFIESWVKYDRELAIVASRDIEGRVRSFPLVETHQYHQVCDWVIAPSDVDHSVEAMAYNIASSILTELNYIGVIAIEFFFGPDGLQVNEIAPRTHNSAHFSIEACSSSQFDQQVCIAAALPVPTPELISPGALMINLLGLREGNLDPLKDRLEKLRELENVQVHWYGKGSERPGRKLGHITILLSEADSESRRQEARRYLKKIRSIWPLETTNKV